MFAVASLGAAACGGNDSVATPGTIDPGIEQGIADQLGGDGDAVAADRPTTMEAWEELWATERAAIVARIAENGWGKTADGTTVTGPAGFTIDLTACPAAWTDTTGLSATEIKVGHTTALSGTLADYGNIARAMQALFAHYNAEDAFTDSQGAVRDLNLLVRDDGYDSARTIPLVDELIDAERVFAMWTLGSPNTLKTYDKLNQRCIPQPFSMTGHPAWGDPVNHPWTTGLQLAYNTEAVLWGEFIEQHAEEFDEEITVASLVMENDFGAAYDSAFRTWLEQSPLRDRIEYVSQTITPQAPTVDNPMTTLAAQDPDVFIAMVAGTACSQAIVEAAQNGMKQQVAYLFQPSVCKASSFVGQDKVGDASDGWWIVGGGVLDLNSPAYDDDAFVTWARELLAANGIDYQASGSFGSGIIFGWAMGQALQVAGELPGGLTRSNLILAIRTMDMTHPMTLPGVAFNMDGLADAYLIEGSDIARYDSARQVWVQQGAPIELSGESGLCAFDQAAGICR